MALKPICFTGKGLSFVGYTIHRFICFYYLLLTGFPHFSKKQVTSTFCCPACSLNRAIQVQTSLQDLQDCRWFDVWCALGVLVKPERLEVAEGPCPHVHLEHMVSLSLTTHRQAIGQAVCQQSPSHTSQHWKRNCCRHVVQLRYLAS